MQFNREWASDVLAKSQRRTRDEALAFVAMVDRVNGFCTTDVAAVLMKTFSSVADHGTQESVVSALSSAADEVRITALLLELPRLVAEASQWAEVLVGQEVDRHPEALLRFSRMVSPTQRDALRTLIQSPDFVDLHPGASNLAI